MSLTKSRRILGLSIAVLAGIVVSVILVTRSSPSGAGAVVGRAIPASAIPKLDAIAIELAKEDGDATPQSVKAVVTTRAKALLAATPTSTIGRGRSEPVYLVLLRGRFVLNDVPTLSGAPAPKGFFLALTIDTRTFKVMDLGLHNNPPPVPLGTFGPVSKLKV